MSSRFRVSRPSLNAVTAVFAVACAVLSLASMIPESARGATPVDPPVFSSGATITNPYFPFIPGGVKTFRGRNEGAPTVVVDIYLSTTRAFSVNGNTVTCRVLQETEFEDGEVHEISTNYFAQADDGTVYYFGETVDVYEGGVIDSHPGSWLVGGPQMGDPVETMTVSVPAVIMPGNPEVGDVYTPEDLPDGSMEIDTIKSVTKTLRTPAGKFVNVVMVSEFSPATGDKETKWYGAGIGVLRAKAKGEILTVDASTFGN